jgi:RNA polymerase sigma factor (sigma-70 family)
MKITEPEPELLGAARLGNLAALNRLLAVIQPGIYNLALRVLGQPEDAADASQEILLKVVMHLTSFRADASFTTWVWRIAHNHLMTARTRSFESPLVSLESITERLDTGLEFADRAAYARGEPGPLTPEDKFEARQVALKCTQSMLMALDREQRIVYLLDTVFDLTSKQAAEVVGITPEAYRQRLSRTRSRLHGFMGRKCGLVNADSACSCGRQLPAVRHMRGSRPVKPNGDEEQRVAEDAIDSFFRISDAASIFRSHPEVQAPEALHSAIRAVLSREGFLTQEPSR